MCQRNEPKKKKKRQRYDPFISAYVFNLFAIDFILQRTSYRINIVYIEHYDVSALQVAKQILHQNEIYVNPNRKNYLQ